jgi:hypothetical protein
VTAPGDRDDMFLRAPLARRLAWAGSLLGFSLPPEPAPPGQAEPAPPAQAGPQRAPGKVPAGVRGRLASSPDFLRACMGRGHR